MRSGRSQTATKIAEDRGRRSARMPTWPNRPPEIGTVALHNACSATTARPRPRYLYENAGCAASRAAAPRSPRPGRGRCSCGWSCGRPRATRPAVRPVNRPMPSTYSVIHTAMARRCNYRGAGTFRTGCCGPSGNAIRGQRHVEPTTFVLRRGRSPVNRALGHELPSFDVKAAAAPPT